MNTSEKHAVVLGERLAGLLAARVLADHFEHITLIERDVYTETAKRVAASRRRITCTDCLCVDVRLSRRLGRQTIATVTSSSGSWQEQDGRRGLLLFAASAY